MFSAATSQPPVFAWYYEIKPPWNAEPGKTGNPLILYIYFRDNNAFKIRKNFMRESSRIKLHLEFTLLGILTEPKCRERGT